jgi:hypothetical protein
LHRPSFHGDYRGTVADAESQYAQAIRAARDYLDLMEVPSAYVDLLTRTNSKNVVFLGALSEDERGPEDIVGYPPSIDEWLKTYCVSLTDQEMAYYKRHTGEDGIFNKYWGAENCRRRVLGVARAKVWASATVH